MPHPARLLTAALLALAGCATAPKASPQVELIEVPVRQYVPVSHELRALLAPCPIATGPLREVVRVARLRREGLERCNGDKAAILELLEKAAEQTRAK